ncbi:hypothetical protein [Rhodococcoides corynebacterioides]|uniref:Uncharacterized protein n=1 Tax=Rhodococcoides corynebacterioides TaxID=53972 RepID=A0ABS7P1N6_9NOCA|nr:hypothetical protein [Rhodococcus corynebacterioides]MBY6366313.1 hypothetical protein [Rhodococcus corynebacterioides]MBY6406776.1 hypothetical protein [Rhodococcus corynebacterioides]
MSHGYPAGSPVLQRGDRAVGFSPSPNGFFVRVWWTHDGNPIGSFGSMADAVQAGLEALGCGDRPDAEQETARIAAEYESVYWPLN